MPPSISEQEENETVETNYNSENYNALKGTRIESSDVIEAKAGRPHGTGKTQVIKATKNYNEAISKTCKKYSEIRKKKLLKHGELSKSCKLVEKSWSLKKRTVLPEKTRPRYKRNSLLSISRGAPPPLCDIEYVLVRLFLQ